MLSINILGNMDKIHNVSFSGEAQVFSASLSAIPELHLPCWPEVFGPLYQRNGGLVALREIPRRSLLMEIPFSKTLCQRNLPEPLQRKSTLTGEQRTILYLMSLKANIQKLRNPHTKQWLSRQTAGFVAFPETLIQASNDKQLYKEYKAYKGYIDEQRQCVLADVNSKQLLESLALNIEEQEFKKLYEWAFQFQATRSFGHTQDIMLIPFFDFFNYDPSTYANVEFLTYDSHQQLQEVMDRMFQTCDFQESQGTGSFYDCNNQIHQSERKTKQNSEISSTFTECLSSEQITPGHKSQIPTKKYLGMITTAPIKTGSELLFDYGKMGNRDLLKNYGYCVRDNVQTVLTVYISKVVTPNMLTYHRDENMANYRRFKLNYDCINENLVKFWAKIHCQKIQESLPALIRQFRENPPPKIKKIDQEFFKANWKQQTEFLTIFQEENEKIYSNQIRLLQRYLQKKRLTWDYFYLE